MRKVFCGIIIIIIIITVLTQIPFLNHWQREIEELKSTSGDSTHKLKEEYLQKLNALESQVNYYL